MRKRTRPGRLTGIRRLLSLMLSLNIVGLILAALTRVSGGNVATFEVEPEQVYGPQPYVLQQTNVGVIRPLDIVVVLDHPSLGQTVLGLLTRGLAYTVATIPMIIYARRLVDEAIATHPFTLSIARGLRRLGQIVLLGGFLAEVVRSLAAIALRQGTIHEGNPLTNANWIVGASFWWIVLGFTILAFAQVVEHGCTLRQELDEVI
jgi:hypothetical protein